MMINMNSKRLVVGIAALLLSALSFSSVFTRSAEAQVGGEMAAPVAAAIGGLFLGIGNVLNSLYTTICGSCLSIILIVVEFVRSVFNMVYEAICGAGSGFFMVFAAVWIFCVGLGVSIPCLNFFLGPLTMCCGWCPGCIGGAFGGSIDALLRGCGEGILG